MGGTVTTGDILTQHIAFCVRVFIAMFNSDISLPWYYIHEAPNVTLLTELVKRYI